MHACMHAHRHAHVHRDTRMHTDTCTHTHMYTHTHTQTHTCTHTHTHTPYYFYAQAFKIRTVISYTSVAMSASKMYTTFGLIWKPSLIFLCFVINELICDGNYLVLYVVHPCWMGRQSGWLVAWLPAEIFDTVRLSHIIKCSPAFPLLWVQILVNTHSQSGHLASQGDLGAC